MKMNRWAELTVVCGLLLTGAIQAAETNQATLTVRQRSLSFNHFTALEGESYGEKRFLVIATVQPLTPEQVKKVQKKGAEENNDVELGQPHLKAVYTDAGEMRYCFGQGLQQSFGQKLDPSEGNAILENGRLVGKMEFEETGTFAKKVTMQFDLPLGASSAPAPKKPAEPPVKPSVSGKYTGNDKDAKLAFVSVLAHEEFNGKRAITLLFTEKDHSKSQKPSFGAAFGDFGSALILSVNETGDIFGCEVAHQALPKVPFSSLGSINMERFELSENNVKGKVKTDGVVDTFDQKWFVELEFAAPLSSDAKKELAKASVPAPKSEDEQEKDDEEMEDEDEEEKPGLNVMELTLPKDAGSIEYKKLVKQIKFVSTSKVNALAQEFTKSLTAQGWKTSGSDLVTPKSAILKRTKGDAELTIMFKPSGTGSEAVIFTEGMDFSAAPSPAKKADKKNRPEIEGLDDIEKKARDAINEALDEVFEE